MSRLHLRYLLMCAAATLVASFFVALFFIALIRQFTGLALISGYFSNLATAGLVAIMAGRRAAVEYKLVDPRLGSVAGLWMGVWVGAGAVLGMVGMAAALGWLFQILGVPSDIPRGLVLSFSLVSFAICLFAARIAGREAARPPAEEEA